MAKNPDNRETHSRWWRLLAGLLVGGLLLFVFLQQMDRPPDPVVPVYAKARPTPVPAPGPAPAPAAQPPREAAVPLGLLAELIKVLEDGQDKDGVDPGDLQPLVDRLQKMQEKQRQKQQMQAKGAARRDRPPPQAEAEWPKGPVEFVRFGPRRQRPVPEAGVRLWVMERDFHAVSQHEGVTIVVRGRVGDGTVTVQSISIKDEAREQRFQRLADVPADCREQVRGVLERATRGRVKP
jgi:hypothetical protein